MKTAFHFCLSIVLFLSSALRGDDCCSQVTTNPSQPNIVVILVDDMGYGDPGCYNSESKIRTPNIDSLAADGLRFTDAHAPGPLCHMSRYGLLSGRYPFRTDVSQWPKHPLLEDGHVTLASLLRHSGYTTAMVGKWHLGFEENGYDQRLPGGPVDRGFDSFFGIRASTDIPPYFYIRGDFAVEPPTQPIEASQSPGWSPIQGKFWRAGQIAPNMKLENVLPRFTQEAIQVIETHASAVRSQQNAKPLFLYLAYPAPHTPWLPSKEFSGRSSAGMYGDFVEMTDAMVGRVLESLDKQGMRENTMVIFSSDNGPTWYDQDVIRFGHDSSGGLRGMKADAWEAGHRVPFIVRWPGKTPKNTSTSQLLCFTDLVSTFASLSSVDIAKAFPNSKALDSFNLLPVFLDPESKHANMRSEFIMRSGSGLMVARSGEWKLIDGLGSGGFTKPSKRQPEGGEPKGQLYNLANDLAEQVNLYDQQPEVVRQLTRLIQEQLPKP